MPSYYNPYMNAYPIAYGVSVYNPMQSAQPMQQQPQTPQTYMINVDGENAAKSWQPTTVPQPNTIIPLFDSDGQHVYFKTYDTYGRMNPIRKGRIVFDDEIQVSEISAPEYATKGELDNLIQEVKELKQKLGTMPQNQNGNNNRGERR